MKQFRSVVAVLALAACGGMQTNADGGTAGGAGEGSTGVLGGGRAIFDAGRAGGSVGGGSAGGAIAGGSSGGGEAGGLAGGGSAAGGSAGGSFAGGLTGGGTTAGGTSGGGDAGGFAGGGGAFAGGLTGGGSAGGSVIAPATPTDFAATVESATSVRLTWAAPSSAPSIYELERGAAASGPFTLVVQPAGSVVTYLDQGLTSGTTVWYRLRAVMNGTPSAWTTPVSATPAVLNGPPDAPTQPAVGSPTENSLTITWVDSSSNESGFEVQRAPVSQGPFFTFVTRPAGSTSVVDTGLAPGTPFHYRVRAINALGASDYTLTTSGITRAPNDPTMPMAVQEVINSAGVVRFTWSDQSQAEGRYEIMRSTDNVNWPSSTFVPADTTSWIDTAPAFGTNYYRVRASSGLSVSNWAQTSVYAGPIIIGLLCQQPTATSATAVGSLIRIGFTYASFPCETVVIERSTNSTGPFNEVGRSSYFFALPAPPRNTTWDDTTVLPGVTYYYRLRTAPASSGGQQYSGSAPTTVFSASVSAPLSAPTNLQVTLQSATEASFSFTDTTTNETGFDVEIATAAAGPFSPVFQLPANTTSGGLAQMTAGTAYWLRVRTVRGSVQSPPSNVVPFTTPTRSRLVTTADVVVMKSTAASNNQNLRLNDYDSVGCFFTAFPNGAGGFYQFHNCGGALLQFNTSSLAGRTVVAAWLEMTPCQLAPGPVQGQMPLPLNATYAAFALAGSWSPSAVTYNTMPQWYVNAPVILAPNTSGAVAWNITTTVRNWVSGTWAQNGLFVQHAPIVDRVPASDVQGNRNWDQTTSFCSLERTPAAAPALIVDLL